MDYIPEFEGLNKTFNAEHIVHYNTVLIRVIPPWISIKKATTGVWSGKDKSLFLPSLKALTPLN